MSRAALILLAKELRETLRDRRTVALMVLLPVVLYPAMLLLVAQVAGAQRAELEATTAHIAVLGEPAPVDLLAALDDAEGLDRVDAAADAIPEALLAEGAADAALVLEPGFTVALAEGATGSATIVADQTRDLSRLAHDRAKEALVKWRDGVLAVRLSTRGLPAGYARPLELSLRNAAPPAQMGGFVLSQIVPLLLILTVILGAFHPAVDLTAGEKERGTLQTLLTAPIRSGDIVAGKFLAVCVMALLAGAVNIGSIGLVFSQAASMMGEGAPPLELSLSAGTLALLFVAVVAMGLFFSALMMTVAVLARSYKEAQHILTPLYLACVVPAVIAQLPGMELGPALALVPAVNLALLVKGVLQGRVGADAAFLVLASTAVYTSLVLALAARLFRSAPVLLGETIGLRPLLARATGPRPRRPHPSPGEALTLFGVLFVLLYYVGGLLQRSHPLAGVAATLWGLILPATVLFALVIRVDLRTTLRLRAPSARAVIAALLCGLGAWAVVSAIVVPLQSRFLPVPKELVDTLEGLLDVPEGPVGVLALGFVLALTPAICEEVAFRGFILSGLGGLAPGAGAIVATATLFGVLHLSLFRFAGTFLLGVVAGVLAARSRSLWPAALFHFTSNGALLVASQLPPRWGIVDPASGMPALAVVAACALLLAGGLALAWPVTPSPKEI